MRQRRREPRREDARDRGDIGIALLQEHDVAAVVVQRFVWRADGHDVQLADGAALVERLKLGRLVELVVRDRLDALPRDLRCDGLLHRRVRPKQQALLEERRVELGFRAQHVGDADLVALPERERPLVELQVVRQVAQDELRLGTLVVLVELDDVVARPRLLEQHAEHEVGVDVEQIHVEEVDVVGLDVDDALAELVAADRLRVVLPRRRVGDRLHPRALLLGAAAADGASTATTATEINPLMRR